MLKERSIILLAPKFFVRPPPSVSSYRINVAEARRFDRTAALTTANPYA
jgi:hypothetical protein